MKPKNQPGTEPMFFCEPLPPVGGIAQLTGDEARHAAGARRLKQGDTLWLFDGRGGIGCGELHALRDRGRIIEATIVAREEQPAPAAPLHLACALPKGDRAAVMLDMATQLGMMSFTPLLSERSVVDPGKGTLERLRRVCLEACKQSRRAHLPTVLDPLQFNYVVEVGEPMWIAHPGGEPVAKLAPTVQGPLLLLIGPEGGFTDEEVARAVACGATRVSLGAGILRIETAAVALLAALQLAQAS